MVLEGTLDTPFGAMKKQTAVLVGGGLVLILGIVWYRSKKQSQAASVAAAGSSEIDPATGFPFGSPEDVAALSNQSGYLFPAIGGGGGGGGGGTTTPGPGSFTNNAQWSAYVLQQIGGSDPAKLQAAIGQYLSGAPATIEQQGLIHQATAVGGLPPVSGPTGFPPAINTSPTTEPAPTPTTPESNQAWEQTALAWWGKQGYKGTTALHAQIALNDYLTDGKHLGDWEWWIVNTTISGGNVIDFNSKKPVTFLPGIGPPPNIPSR